jgi:hypothetical protein
VGVNPSSSGLSAARVEAALVPWSAQVIAAILIVVSLAIWLLAFVWAINRDITRSRKQYEATRLFK